MKHLLIVLLLSSAGWAQKVYVDSSVKSEDVVGNAFVFAVKEQLRKSATYTVLDASDGKCVEIDLVSVKDGEGATAISVVTRMPWNDGGSLLIGQQVLLVGRAKVDEMAANLVADTDASLSKLRATFLKELSKTTPPSAAH